MLPVSAPDFQSTAHQGCRRFAFVIAAGAVAAVAFAELSTRVLENPEHRASAGNATEVTVLIAEYPSRSHYLLKNPHFSIFPGDGVEIVPVLPIPGA